MLKIEQFPLTIHGINLPQRKDRKYNLRKEFISKNEFILEILCPISDKNATKSLWLTIKEIVQNRSEDNFVIICEDDHLFTQDYSKDFLFESLSSAKEKNADILLGGTSWCNNAIPVNDHLFWVDRFSGLQFAVIFKTLYSKILEANFENHDCADYKICDLSDKKFVIYPFISVQKDYGYSDVTPKNNGEGKVTKLFYDSSASLSSLLHVKKIYRENFPNSSSFSNNYDIISIPTYIIHLPERTERLEHIKKEFTGRKEFDLTIVEACRHTIGAVGLWQSIRKVISLAVENDDDVIILCEDDHTFTQYYNRDSFIQNVLDAHYQGCDVLSAGIGGFSHAIPLADNRYWVSSFWCTQFIVMYRKFFQPLLQESFDDTVTADDKISEMTSHKMVLHPFMSVQRDFGYSDVTQSNKIPGRITRHFDTANHQLQACADAYKRYLSK